jgi:pyrroloquinoline quinone biosynthesis protein B
VWLPFGEAAAAEVVVLGVAQDGGHPQAGCTRACCAAAWDDPRRGHLVASLAVVDGDRAWIVDATPDLPAQLHALQREGRTLAGVLLTHAHMGHYTGLLHLGREVMGASAVPVVALPRMAELLRTQEPWALSSRLGHVAVVDARPGEPVTLGSVVATPFLVPHRDELSETVGWRLQGPTRTVVWLPDIDKWERWDTPLEDLLRGVDVAWLDGTFFADGELSRPMAEVPHPFVSETMARLATAPPELRAKVRFVHLNHTNPALDPASDAAARVRAAGFRVAAEGDREPL